MAIRASLISEVLKMDREDLNRVIEAVRSRREILAQEDKARFSVGDVVTFRPTRGRWRGVTVRGTVEKVMRKNLRVYDSTNLVEWTVHPAAVTLEK